MKIQGDSIMRVTYGDYLFENYFQFRPGATYAYCGWDHKRMWDAKMYGQSICCLDLIYEFVYPGTDPHYHSNYSLSTNADVKLEMPLYKYYGRGPLIAPERVSKLCSDSLHRPLKQCHVDLYQQQYFTDSLRTIKLDSSHVYLQVEYEKIKYRHRHNYLDISRWDLLIDACTGEFIGRSSHFYKGYRWGCW